MIKLISLSIEIASLLTSVYLFLTNKNIQHAQYFLGIAIYVRIQNFYYASVIENKLNKQKE